MNFRWVKDLDLERNAIVLFEENIEEYFQCLGGRKNLKPLKHNAWGRKVDEFGHVKFNGIMNTINNSLTVETTSYYLDKLLIFRT